MPIDDITLFNPKAWHNVLCSRELEPAAFKRFMDLCRPDYSDRFSYNDGPMYLEGNRGIWINPGQRHNIG